MSYTNDNIGISKDWLLNNHPQVLEEWLAHTKPQRDLEAKRIKEKFDAVQKWLDELKDHPRWKTQDSWQKAVQMTLDMYNTTDDEEERANMWSSVLALAGRHPSFPKRRGTRSEEE